MSIPSNIVFATQPRELLKIEKFLSASERIKVVAQISAVDLVFQIVFKSSLDDSVCADWRLKTSFHDILALRLRSNSCDQIDQEGELAYSVELSINLNQDGRVAEVINNQMVEFLIPDVIQYCSRLLIAAKQRNIILVTPHERNYLRRT